MVTVHENYYPSFQKKTEQNGTYVSLVFTKLAEFCKVSFQNIYFDCVSESLLVIWNSQILQGRLIMRVMWND